ncbi:MAG: phosphoglycerate kinase [Patescibacteria group bacterium]
MKTLKDFNVENKRVLVRCDFNVPIDSNGNILDDFRIKKTLPTIKHLVENNAKIILMSHLGEPDGKVVEILKLDNVQKTLEKLLNINIIKSSDCIGEEIEELSKNLKEREILLLENLRFHKEETDNDLEFAKKLSCFGDIYVNEAFGVDHRKNASLTGTPQFLDHCAGLLLEKEIENLNKVLENPEKPMTAIVGGKKVETKSRFINRISKIADFVIISGLIKKEVIEKNIEFEFPEKIIGPEDNLDALDIDEKAIKMFQEKIATARTIIWNGPFGKFEEEKYAKGTLAIAKAIIESRAFSVIGGGETVEFVEKHSLMQKFSHVSTGGGAMMAYLSGEEMPGLKALN